MELNYKYIKNILETEFNISPADKVSVTLTESSMEDLITVLAWAVGEAAVKNGVAEDPSDFKFDDFELLNNISEYIPVLKKFPLTIDVKNTTPIEVTINTTGDDLIKIILSDANFSEALDVLNNRDLEFFIWCSLCNVIESSPCNYDADDFDADFNDNRFEVPWGDTEERETPWSKY